MRQPYLSPELDSKLVNKLKEIFTYDEQQLYIANLYMYLTFDQTKDFPINLENVYGFLGFSNKGNAKRTLENNFIINEDYIKEKDLAVLRNDNGCFSSENIMLNIDTFKNMCMLVKTENGKKIRKYYTKLESIYNEIIKEQLDTNNNDLIKQLTIKEKEHQVALLLKEQEHKEQIQLRIKQLEEKEINYKNLQKEKELERHNILLSRKINHFQLKTILVHFHDFSNFLPFDFLYFHVKNVQIYYYFVLKNNLI